MLLNLINKFYNFIFIDYPHLFVKKKRGGGGTLGSGRLRLCIGYKKV